MIDSYPTSSRTDEELIRLVRATRNSRYLGQLCSRYYDKVFMTCLSWLKRPDLAADCTQDIFVRVHLKIDAFQFQSSFSTWLFAISRNHCADQVRYNKRHPGPLSLFDQHLDGELGDPLADDVDARVDLIEHCMGLLKPEDQQLLRLKYLSEFKVEDMARQYAVSESAMKMRLKRARARLESIYQHQEY